ncbi:hypothetical protein RI129_000312 [Pyrocoelia pectoralis]|uniref:Carboxylic ester hydrolase n=1 Tax=Pyrocoelia pectoralis TaxID=417401 RepID=A0AAN7ZVV7_9COLE
MLLRGHSRVSLLLNAITFKNNSVINCVPEVHTKLGKIRGYYKKSAYGRTFSAFEGIPYAKPPIGDLRFEAPQPVSSWSTTLNATTLYVCKQVKSLYSILERYHYDQEDCLYLNVYVASEQPSENDNLDVIVNIHGGSFTYGDGYMSSPNYILDRDVVFVNFNYRLGILGFLSTEDEILPGNNGLKDQQLALKWVQAHIKQFGGNPKSVTLMGNSAGGASVHFHYFSPGSEGLFHRGISLSGNVLMPWAIQEGALEKARKVATLLNCTYQKTNDMVDCLKVVPVDEIILKTAAFHVATNYSFVPFAPVVEVKSENSFITRHPYKLLEEGEINHVPWLTCITSDEGVFFTALLSSMLEEIDRNWNELSQFVLDYAYVVHDGDKRDVAQKIKSFYFQSGDLQDKFHKYGKLIGDRYFNVGFEIASLMQAKLSKSPVYAGLYSFSASKCFAKVIGWNLKGVLHGDDFLLIHGSPFETYPHNTKPDQLMTNSLLDILTSFASDGNPRTKQVIWEPVTTDTFRYLLIRDVDNMNMTMEDKFSPREFWENLDIMENDKVMLTRDEF